MYILAVTRDIVRVAFQKKSLMQLLRKTFR